MSWLGGPKPAWPLPGSWEVTTKPLECPVWKGVTVHLGPWALHTEYANSVTEGGAWLLQCHLSSAGAGDQVARGSSIPDPGDQSPVKSLGTQTQ